MARPREFDEEAAVADAVTVFWRLGYNATSVRDLGEALRLSPSSLYRTFGDKHRLFLRALDHYRDHESTEGLTRFQAAAPTVDDLVESLIAIAIGADAQADEPAGCFAVNTAAEIGYTDPEVATRTEAAFDLTRTGLRDLLCRLRDTGQLPATADPDTLTDALFTLIIGWRVRIRAGHSAAELTSSIQRTVAALTGRPTTDVR
ncbi:TetR/AcrR family transcriptional regulator [Pseudonocardia acaciae]|uniref:TetR/AcrR family transcriptional regulator n=1 Tax=Pseudonocardia acaciae TaxID=551276 RepID=UPI00048E36FB|nr:TetR/AcrR family transcriptional regulator [Pseudonocardia acaciae]